MSKDSRKKMGQGKQPAVTMKSAKCPKCHREFKSKDQGQADTMRDLHASFCQ